ncbi:MAG TPA: 4-hydroxy-tetrahydrodipicolinate reductase [Longimicrobiaceae bacterium]|nr:4-hydroxy-tetrahydrodipicolinate reductase [Longimicrobiaceae bacterium]
MSVAEPVRVVLSGASGRMGRTLARLAAEGAGVEVLAGLDRRGDPEGACDIGCPVLLAPEDAGEVLAAADVVVDFSAPEFLARLLRAQGGALAGRALVVGTTGLGDGERSLLDGLSRSAAVLTAANFSVGVNLLAALVEEAARVLGPAYDVEVVEAHHRRKADAPSGTALELARAAARGHDVELDSVRRDGRSGRPGERPAGEIGLHAVRGGDVVGEHRVMFLGDRERLELAHLAQDRALFAEGALRAARWIAGKPAGAYTMRDVLGLG